MFLEKLTLSTIPFSRAFLADNGMPVEHISTAVAIFVTLDNLWEAEDAGISPTCI